MLRGSDLATEVVYVERERPVNKRWFMLRGSGLSTEVVHIERERPVNRGGLC